MGECGHECEVARADLDDLRSEMADRIDDLSRSLDELREQVRDA